jgi:hypothetical protein
MEIWKPVVGFEGRYEVSSFGRIKALARNIYYKDGRVGFLEERLLKGVLTKTGYFLVSFDSKKRKFIHQAVAEAFLGKTEYKMTVNHKDGNKLNNKLENLEWNTYKQNNDHARATGLNKQHGVNCNLAKHSDQFINAVRNVYAKYNPSYAELGKMFGLTGCHARQIVLYETRKKPTF